jgi:uncharacterized protein YndB with AHSA1/START domain
VPTVSEKRSMSRPAGDIWKLVSDPRQLTRWWPRVERVEGIHGAMFTEMLRTAGGKLVRADFEVIERDAREMRIVWEQHIADSPFAHLLSASRTEVRVRPADALKIEAPSEVELTLAHTPKKWFSGASASPRQGGAATEFWTAALGRLGSPMVSRGAARTVKEALDRLDDACA